MVAQLPGPGFQNRLIENQDGANLDSMKTTVDIPEQELKEAMRHTGAKTKREAVVIAIAELNRRRRLRKLVESFGTLDDFMSQEDLRRMREQD